MTRSNDDDSHASAQEREPQEHEPLSRRHFLRGAGEVAAGGVLGAGLLARGAAGAPGARVVPVLPGIADDVETLAGEIDVELSINGARQTVRIEPRTTLLNALRNHCSPALTGTKLVCDRGNCGACTVIVDGEPRYSCLQLAADMRGREIRTIEGLAHGDELTPLQDEFCRHDALMCGFCTPGFLMAITATLERDPQATLADIQAGCAGNLCRCGTYPHIFAAAEAALRRTKGR